jgi:uncharacterized membrane protein YeaQ/YmgE (transglycosylase-associated protein family)
MDCVVSADCRLDANSVVTASVEVDTLLQTDRATALHIFRSLPLNPRGIVAQEGKMMAFIIWLIVGAAAGWIAGIVVKGGGFGLIGNIVVGILGSIVAGILFPLLGLSLGPGLIGAVVHAAIGAILLLLAVSVLRRA